MAIAIFSGYNMVIHFYQNSNREQLVDKIFQIYQSALQYKKTHGSLGGGSGSFSGWTIPNKLKESITGSFTYKSGTNYLVLIGEGSLTGWDGETPTRVWIRFHDINDRTIRFSN